MRSSACSPNANREQHATCTTTNTMMVYCLPCCSLAGHVSCTMQGDAGQELLTYCGPGTSTAQEDHRRRFAALCNSKLSCDSAPAAAALDDLARVINNLDLCPRLQHML